MCSGQLEHFQVPAFLSAVVCRGEAQEQVLLTLPTGVPSRSSRVRLDGLPNSFSSTTEPSATGSSATRMRYAPAKPRHNEGPAVICEMQLSIVILVTDRCIEETPAADTLEREKRSECRQSVLCGSIACQYLLIENYLLKIIGLKMAAITRAYNAMTHETTEMQQSKGRNQASHAHMHRSELQKTYCRHAGRRCRASAQFQTSDRIEFHLSSRNISTHTPARSVSTHRLRGRYRNFK